MTSAIEFNNILVGLDMSSRDNYVNSFLSKNLEALDIKKVDFIHVKEKKTSKLSEAEIKENLSHKIQETFSNNDLETKLHLLHGNPTEEIRKEIKNKNTDLLVVGYKKSRTHNLETQKLVKKPASSLILIPNKEDYSIKKICVALDFSELSMQALKKAINMANHSGAKIVGLHAYKVPAGYHKSGKNHREYAKIMEENAKNKAQIFLDKAGIGGIEIEYIYDEDNEPATCIAQFARDSHSDLVLIGSKGRTNAASILLGSVAKELSKKLYDIPLMIVKVKNENMDFVDAIKKV